MATGNWSADKSDAMKHHELKFETFKNEMASKMGEQLILFFVLNGSRLKMSSLVVCKMKTKLILHSFNRDAQKIEMTCKNHCNYNMYLLRLAEFINFPLAPLSLLPWVFRMAEIVIFSLPDLAAISDEHLRLRPTIKAVNYHQSEETHLKLRLRRTLTLCR